MEESLKTYERNIKKKHNFGWTPKYEEEFRTKLNEKVFIPIAEKTFEKLDWDLVFKDDKNIEANRTDSNLGFKKWTESITISFSHSKINVKSESMGNEMWDNGRNSKRVKLFIHAFKETEKSFDKESIEKLEIETTRKNNWDDYVVPENLPKPNQIKKPNFVIPLIGAITVSICIALILAKVTVSGVYIIGLFEFLVAIAIAFSLKYLIKLANFTEFLKLKYLLIGIIIFTYILNQYFQYEIILRENNYERIGFIEFIKLRFEQGLTVNKLKTGWIGLVISWGLQIFITYHIGLLRLIINISSYKFKRVPIEVIDFAYYHFVKQKSKEQIINELKNKGWIEKQNQDEVFEAIDAIYDTNKLKRMT